MSAEREIGFAEVREELARGNRVLLLVRHGERMRIDHEDPTFGETVPLTPTGEATARRFGAALRGSSAAVEFRASPLLRTVRTAELIAEEMGFSSADIVRDDLIGNASPFYSDRREAWQEFRNGRFFACAMEYLARGVRRGFSPLAPAAEAYEKYVTDIFTATLGVFVTHDIFIAAYLHAKGVKTDFNPDNWPRFLDAAAIFIEPSGRRRHAFVRTGLSTRACGIPPPANR